MKKTIVLLVLVFSLLAFMPAHIVNAYTASIPPNITRLYLGKGTADLPKITYDKTFYLPFKVDRCEIDDVLTNSMSGITATVTSKYCQVLSEHKVKIHVEVQLEGPYEGGTFSYQPVSDIYGKFYYNESIVDYFHFTTTPIDIYEAQLTIRIPESGVKVDSYTVTPSNPRVGEEIVITPKGRVTLEVSANELSADWPLILKVQGKTKAVELTSRALVQAVVIDGVNLYGKLSVDVYSSNYYVGRYNVDIPSTGAGYATLSVQQPYYYPDERANTIYISGIISVSSIKGTIHAEIGTSYGRASLTIRSAGIYEYKINTKENSFEKLPSSTMVSIGIIFTGPDGKTVRFSIPYLLEKTISGRGSIAGVLMFWMFTVVLGIGIIMSFAGIFLRNPTLISQGAFTLALASFIFLAPLIIVSLLKYMIISLDLPDVINIRYIGGSLMRFFAAIDSAINYISSEAATTGGTLFVQGSAALSSALGLMITLILAIGPASTATFGAVGALVNAFADPIISGLVTWGSALVFVGLIMSALGTLYPILVNAILIITVAVAVLNALFVSITGSPVAVYQSISSYFIIILLILVSPYLLAMVSAAKFRTTNIHGNIPVLNIPINIPYTRWIVNCVLGLISTGILALVLYLMFQRLISMISYTPQR